MEIFMTVKETASRLVEKFGTRDPFELAEKCSVYVMFEDLGTVNGYYMTAFGVKSIHINEKLSPRQKEICCAHELGHAIMHENLNTFFLITETFLPTDKYERQANMFASYLLFPDEILKEYEGYSAAEIAAALEAPVRMIEERRDLR